MTRQAYTDCKFSKLNKDSVHSWLLYIFIYGSKNCSLLNYSEAVHKLENLNPVFTSFVQLYIRNKFTSNGRVWTAVEARDVCCTSVIRTYHSYCSVYNDDLDTLWGQNVCWNFIETWKKNISSIQIYNRNMFLSHIQIKLLIRIHTIRNF